MDLLYVVTSFLFQGVEWTCYMLLRHFSYGCRMDLLYFYVICLSRCRMDLLYFVTSFLFQGVEWTWYIVTSSVFSDVEWTCYAITSSLPGNRLTLPRASHNVDSATVFRYTPRTHSSHWAFHVFCRRLWLPLMRFCQEYFFCYIIRPALNLADFCLPCKVTVSS